MATAEQDAGAKVRALRTAKGWSQQALAQHLSDYYSLNWLQSTVAKTEAALRPIRLNELSVLAHALDVPLLDLVSGEDR